VSQLDDILNRLRAYANLDEVEQVEKAYRIARRACDAESRVHARVDLTAALGAAQILAELEASVESVAAALLVNVGEQRCSPEEITQEIGESVSDLVVAVRRLRAAPYLSGENKQTWSDRQRAELYHAFVSTLEGPLPILIELAFQLYALRHLPRRFPTDQREVIFDALQIYAPLAHRLGVWRIKWEMEDRAFRFVHPEAYHRIAGILNERRENREESIDRLAAILGKELAKHNIHAEITGRPKHIYSIYRKMQRKGVPLEAIYDIRALRVLVNEPADCYQVLSMVHQLWKPIPGELDDYIANPKANGYRSLHTAVFDEENKTLEVQIRTYEMHAEAELGFAAHWRYKERGGAKQLSRKKKDLAAEQAIEDKISWLRSLLGAPDNGELALVEEKESGDQEERPRDEFIFASTPMGDLIRLRAGATPIDFAYRIHTELGHRCYGARVNGRVVALDYQLESGDVVEIITRKRGGPNPNWLSQDNRFVQTKEARQKIAAWFRAQERTRLITRGHEIVDRELAKAGLKSTLSFDQVAQYLNAGTTDEMLIKIGSDDISVDKLRAAILAGPKPSREERAREADRELVSADETKTLIEKKPEAPPVEKGLLIASTSGLYSRLAQCCCPVPDEKIVGYVTRGHGVTIHQAECPNVNSGGDSVRIVPAGWGDTTGQLYPVRIMVEALNRKGLMGDIGQAVAQENVDITEATVKKKTHWAVFELVLEVADIEQLGHILEKLAQTSGVRSVYRKIG
jgi:RelA/SpoT family (p)ppGpp synthetase